MKQIIQIMSIASLLLMSSCCDSTCNKQKYAEMLIERVDAFKKSNDRLPTHVSELGLIELEDSPAFYQIKSDTTFIIWIGLSIGESRVYRSWTKEWKDEG